MYLRSYQKTSRLLILFATAIHQISAPIQPTGNGVIPGLAWIIEIMHSIPWKLSWHYNCLNRN